MTVKELKEILNQESIKDTDSVVIVLSEPSIGPIATSGIIGLTVGFDWESNMILIHPKDKLIRVSDDKNDENWKGMWK